MANVATDDVVDQSQHGRRTSVELGIAAAEAAGVVQDAVPVLAHEGGTGEALRLVRRRPDEDFIDDEVE